MRLPLLARPPPAPSATSTATTSPTTSSSYSGGSPLRRVRTHLPAGSTSNSVTAPIKLNRSRNSLARLLFATTPPSDSASVSSSEEFSRPQRPAMPHRQVSICSTSTAGTTTSSNELDLTPETSLESLLMRTTKCPRCEMSFDLDEFDPDAHAETCSGFTCIVDGCVVKGTKAMLVLHQEQCRALHSSLAHVTGTLSRLEAQHAREREHAKKQQNLLSEALDEARSANAQLQHRLCTLIRNGGGGGGARSARETSPTKSSASSHHKLHSSTSIGNSTPSSSSEQTSRLERELAALRNELADAQAGVNFWKEACLDARRLVPSTPSTPRSPTGSPAFLTPSL